MWNNTKKHRPKIQLTQKAVTMMLRCRTLYSNSFRNIIGSNRKWSGICWIKYAVNEISNISFSLKSTNENQAKERNFNVSSSSIYLIRLKFENFISFIVVQWVLSCWYFKWIHKMFWVNFRGISFNKIFSVQF